MSPDGSLVAFHSRSWSVVSTYGEVSGALPPGAMVLDAGRRGSEFLISDGDGVCLFDPRGEERRDLAVRKEELSHCGIFGGPVLGPKDTILLGRQLFELNGKVVTELPSVDDGLWLGGFCSVRASVVSTAGSWALGTAGGIEGDVGSLLVADENGVRQALRSDGPVYALAFSTDGSRLYCGMAHGVSIGMGPPHKTLRVYDPSDLSVVRERDNVMVTEWFFLDEARALVVANSELQVWDVDSLRSIQSLGPCHTLAVSEDRRTLATWVYTEPERIRVHRLRLEADK